jgi:hypothetical protein
MNLEAGLTVSGNLLTGLATESGSEIGKIVDERKDTSCVDEINETKLTAGISNRWMHALRMVTRDHSNR